MLQDPFNLYATVGVEILASSGRWFTQSLRKNAWKPSAFGQVELNHQRARINWLLTCDEADPSALPQLIDNLAVEAGLHGAKFLLASSTQQDGLFEILRQAGYCRYGWERYWKVKPTAIPLADQREILWQDAMPVDIYEIEKFQHKHLSPAVRSVMPLAGENLPDLILREKGSLQAIGAFNHGTRNRKS